VLQLKPTRIAPLLRQGIYGLTQLNNIVMIYSSFMTI